MEKKKVVFILGPTAVGKSDVAVKVAQSFSGEIISADSVQVFRGLDIGSAKITKDEMQNVPHFGIDIVDPFDRFSAFEFVQYANQKIDEISKRSHLPIVVGGTGLFVKSLTEGYNFGGQTDVDVKEEVSKIMSQGLDFAFQKLVQVDEEVASEIDRFNPERVRRALEIALSGGKKDKKETDIDSLIFVLNMPREKIYERIDRRVDIMIENGLENEVKNLLANGVSADAQSMRAIGYKEVVENVQGKISREKMIELVKQHSRNYAKRQITFLKKIPSIWVDMTEKDAVEKIFKEVEKFLKT